MIDTMETKQQKAMQIQYKDMAVKDLNIRRIYEELGEIQKVCRDVRRYYETNDSTLINDLDGDEKEAFKFKMIFGDLCTECDKMLDDLNKAWIPECFDLFFVAVGAGKYFRGLHGYDTYQRAWVPLGYSDDSAEDESKEALKRLTKDNLIDAARQCFWIYQSFIALHQRYDCLKETLYVILAKISAKSRIYSNF